ncbi:uncharacterized protein LOC115955715 [Quercus lobata]|uniref:uncharacterized protein LOC115955715 n=1 Tax=Quercus lobata TaxID=97700 RepID=UPI001244158E|nr:uncharacterized protein LOC115955715 [Quercus lobata]
MEEPSSASENQVMVDDDDGGEVKGGEIPRFEIKVTYEAKLNEILHNINSIEIKLCSDGVKDFIKLLKGHPDRVYNAKDGERKAISKDLNKFARLLIEEYMVDIQKELDSKEVKCQKATLLLMASIV